MLSDIVRKEKDICDDTVEQWKNCDRDEKKELSEKLIEQLAKLKYFQKEVEHYVKDGMKIVIELGK